MNLNKLFNGVANIQDIEVGSELWRSGGIEPYSGSTGGHAAYGWKHDHLLTPEWARAVIANYGHRRSYYTDPKRQVSYEAAGRPVDWKPEDFQDLTDGQTAWITSKGVIKVSGPDLLHFHIGPLTVVWDNNPKINGDYSSKMVSGAIIQFLMASLAGQLRGSKYYLFGDRGVANILKASVQAGKRGLILKEDMDTIGYWLESKCLPFYEKAPGHDYGVKGLAGFQVYNGLYWLLPAFYDLYNFLPDGELKNRIWKIAYRFSNWMKDLYELKGDFNIYQVDFVDDSILKLGPAPESLNGLIKLQAPGEGSDWSLWGYRAVRVSAKILNDTKLEEVALTIFNKFNGDKKYDNQMWLVDAENNYVNG